MKALQNFRVIECGVGMKQFIDNRTFFCVNIFQDVVDNRPIV
jgi:hypothetical protein